METFVITKPSDAIPARERVREMARTLGFGLVDQTNLAFTITEFALKLIATAEYCRLHIEYYRDEEGKTGIEVRLYERHAEPGYVDSEWAAQLVDDLDVNCDRSDETLITLRKWRTSTSLSNDSSLLCPVTETGEEP